MLQRESGELPQRLILSGARVFDVGNGRFSEPRTVVIAAEEISEMYPGTHPEARAANPVMTTAADGPEPSFGRGSSPGSQRAGTIVDLRGTFLLPGLIDAHFHLVSRSASVADEALIAMSMVEGVVNARARLAGGVTTVRDAGCRHWGIHQLVAAIDAGLIPGPRTFAAGRNPAGPGAPDHWRNVPVRGTAELRAAVRAEIAAGATWVKFVISHADDPAQWARVATFFTEEELRAGVEEAHVHGLRTGVHCEGYEPAAMAVRAGIDALDHAPQLDTVTADMMAHRGVFYVPTLWAFSVDSGIDLGKMTPAQADAVRRGQDEHRASVSRARSAGVVIAAGTDAAGSLPPQDVLVSEMRALCDAGLTRSEAIIAATAGAAGVLGEERRLGAIAPGLAADAIVVDADPLADLTTLSRPLLVVCRGRIVVDNWSPSRSFVSPAKPVRVDTASVTGRWGA